MYRVGNYSNYGTSSETSGSALERYFGYKKNSTTSNKNNSSSSGSSNALNKAFTLYDTTKKAADGVQEHGEKLTSQKEDSLFAKAKENKKTDDVVSEIEQFVSDYNKMASSVKQAGGRTNGQYTRQLRNELNSVRKDLRKIGITYDSDGILTVDKKKLSAASVEELETAFSKDSFVDKIMDKSENIEEKVLSDKESLLAASSSTYNKYGSYNNNSYYNYRG